MYSFPLRSLFPHCLSAALLTSGKGSLSLPWEVPLHCRTRSHLALSALLSVQPGIWDFLKTTWNTFRLMQLLMCVLIGEKCGARLELGKMAVWCGHPTDRWWLVLYQRLGCKMQPV